MHWFEAIIKTFDEERIGELHTERVIIHARNYSEAMAAIEKDYGTNFHSILISEALEGDWQTYTCSGGSEDRFGFLEDWSLDDLRREGA